MKPALKQELPQDRSYDLILNHYMVEKSIEGKLNTSSLEEPDMYFVSVCGDLFRRFPDPYRFASIAN